jgi:outer membrane receptor protein involved in Fe transport
LLLLALSSLAVAQDPGDDLEGELEPEQDEAPTEPAPDAPEPDAPTEPEPTPEPTPTEEPAVEGEVSGGVEIGAEGAVEGEAEPVIEAPPPEPEPSESGEILVTGTRIKRSTAFAASAPVEVIDRKQLEYSGATNLADVVQYLTVAQGSGFQGAAAGAGTVSINLRGLGAGATLVLINGRRMAPSGGGIATHFADIGTIPLAAVERIEILKGGASSIYGSDAVAGVVNIITRKNFDGVRFEMDGQTTEEFDQKDGTISGAIGASSERGRVLLGMNYFRRTELTADKRDWNALGQHYSRQGFPATYIAPGINPMGATMAAMLYAPDPGCASAPSSDVFTEAAGNDVCRFDFRQFRSLLGNGERASAFGSAEYDLTNHTTVFTELNVSRLRGDGISSHFAFPPPLPVVPGNHVDNPWPGTRLQLLGRPFGADEKPPRNTADDDTFRGVAGLKGDLEGAAEDTIFESWEWEIYASFGISRYRNIINDNVREEFQRALDSCSDPSDLSDCYNPFYSSIDGTGTPNSDLVKRRIKGQMEVLNDHALQTYNAGMAGSLFELPGGELGLAFGAEIRHESRSSELDHEANLERYAFLVGNSDARAARDVYSGYVELRWPFFDGIELQTAGRAERYTDIDQTAVSPTVGLTLTPSEIAGRDNVPAALRRLQLRGHAAQAFRAPTIYQSFPGFATVPTLFTVQGETVPSFVPVQTYGNPNLDPESALALSGGIVWSPVRELNLMTDFWHYDYKDRIAAQSAFAKVDVWEVGDRCMPPDGVIVSEDDMGVCRLSEVEVTNINLDGHVVTNGFDFGAMFSMDGETFGGGREDWGTFSLGAVGTYTMTFDIPRDEVPSGPIDGGSYECDAESCNAAGHRNAAVAFPPPIPRWRLNFPVTYSNSGHAISVIPHYISSLQDDIDTGRTGDFLEEIDAFVTLDVMYGYTLKEVVGEELTVRVGVYNVLDQDPPTVTSNLDGFETEAHDPRGRMFYAKLVSEF